MDSPITLQIDNLTISYQAGFGREKIALKDLCLNVKKAEILGLLGPNGAGKTSLIKSIVGLIRPKSGSIKFFGESSSTAALRRQVGYMPEIANYYWFFTPTEILRMFGALSGVRRSELKERIKKILDIVGLSEEENILIKNFSKGMQSRLNIAQALLHEPELLILDEPFSGLDPLGRIKIRDILIGLKSKGKTILLSSHELSEAELICDHLSIMNEGKILRHGPLRELLLEKGGVSLEQYFIKMIGGGWGG